MCMIINMISPFSNEIMAVDECEKSQVCQTDNASVPPETLLHMNVVT